MERIGEFALFPSGGYPSTMPANFRPPVREIPAAELDSQSPQDKGNLMNRATNFGWIRVEEIPIT